jgi:hypothetical protein
VTACDNQSVTRPPAERAKTDPQPGVAWGKPKNDLKIGLTLEKYQFDVGESIYWTVHGVTRASKVSVSAGHAAAWGWTLHFKPVNRRADAPRHLHPF